MMFFLVEISLGKIQEVVRVFLKRIQGLKIILKSIEMRSCKHICNALFLVFPLSPCYSNILVVDLFYIQILSMSRDLY